MTSMTATRFGPCTVAPRALLGALLLVMTVLLPAAVAAGARKILADAALLAERGWIMSGTGLADPSIGPYLGLIEERYLTPASPWFTGQPTFDGHTFAGLTTPEQFCPIICQPPPIPQLTFGDSLAAGMADLDAAIRGPLAAGDNVAVFGFSQSATIATLAMRHLIEAAPGGAYDPANVSFVLIGAPNNPIGGLLTRLQFPPDFTGAPQHLPFLNIPLGIGPSPTDVFGTDIYTAEYDGWANFPQDPLNLLAVINAIVGISLVHTGYPTAGNLADTVSLGSIGLSNFFLTPEQLPILAPIYRLGDFGRVLGDALAPGLKLAIDWGYGNPGAPDAGFSLDGVDPIGVAGPWAVTAGGQLADGDGVFGFGARMDPLQMLAGIQYAGVHGLVNPINDLLGFAGQDPLPQSLTDALLSGYQLTVELDRLLLTGWNGLATALHVEDFIGPAAVFDGSPLISAQPLVDLVGLGFSVFNVFGA